MNKESKNKRKIGILTFHHAQSYGAVLQSYALQQTIKALIPEVEVGMIDLLPKRFNKHSSDQQAAQRKMVFDSFVSQYLSLLTEQKETVTECLAHVLNNQMPLTDIIVGSDQVWNPSILKDCIREFFLFDVHDNVKKISYAASFGTSSLDLNPEFQTLIGTALRKFSYIAVREKSGVEICKELGYDNAKLVLDPTLLASPGIYDCFLDENTCSQKVCGFFLRKASYQPKIMKLIAKKHSLKSSSCVLVGVKSPLFSRIRSLEIPTVEQFVSAIRNAKCIVTDSFHGVCFSIIFKKQFLVLPSKKKERFTRIAELLLSLGLESRIIYDYDSARAANVAIEEIDYQGVNEKLDMMKSFSKKFLKEC